MANSILLPNIGDIVKVPGIDKLYTVIDYKTASMSFLCRDIDGICTWLDGRDLVVIDRKENTLAKNIAFCRTAKDVEKVLNTMGIPYTKHKKRFSGEYTRFTVNNDSGYTEIYKNKRVSDYYIIREYIKTFKTPYGQFYTIV